MEENTQSLENFKLPNELGTVEDLKGDDEEKKLEPTDQGWQDYVLDQLFVDEIVYDKNGDRRPRASGLARVFEKVMGVVIEAHASVYHYEPKRAVVEYYLSYKPHNTYDDVVKSINEVAEVNPDNTNEPYINYAVPSAATVAEGRAYKKALKLRLYTAEEIVPEMEKSRVPENSIAGEGVINAINMLINRCKISKDKYLAKLNEHFKSSYSNLEEMTTKHANMTIQALNKYIQKVNEIPQDIRRDND